MPVKPGLAAPSLLSLIKVPWLGVPLYQPCTSLVMVQLISPTTAGVAIESVGVGSKSPPAVFHLPILDAFFQLVSGSCQKRLVTRWAV